LKFTNVDIRLSVEFKDGVIDDLVRLAKSHYPREFGGVLVGRYVERNSLALIEGHVLPKKYSSSRYSFDRGKAGLRNSLAKHFKDKPSRIYVGEWHTHPDGPPMPSSTDISALHAIVNHDEVFIENPILLIIGLRPEKYELGLHVMYRNRTYSYSEINTGKAIVKQKKHEHDQQGKLK